MVIIDLTARSTTMTSGRWDVGARPDRIFFASTRRIRWILFDTRAHTDFCWVPSGEMESAEPDRPSAQQTAGSWKACPLAVDRGAFPGGLAKPLRRSFSNFTIDGRVSQKFTSATPLGPDMPSMWILAHKAPAKRAKDIAC